MACARSVQSTALIPAEVDDKISDSYRLYLSLLYGEKPVVTWGVHGGGVRGHEGLPGGRAARLEFFHAAVEYNAAAIDEHEVSEDVLDLLHLMGGHHDGAAAIVVVVQQRMNRLR